MDKLESHLQLEGWEAPCLSAWEACSSLSLMVMMGALPQAPFP